MKEGKGREGKRADAWSARSWRTRSRCRMIVRRIESDVGLRGGWTWGDGRWDIRYHSGEKREKLGPFPFFGGGGR